MYGTVQFCFQPKENVAKAVAFKVGDIVQLKSGGPNMSVEEVMDRISGEKVICQWFGGRKLERGAFDPKTLIQAPEDKRDGSR
jgi:uncharacterized protein YodC (DUF2158 family)